MGQTINITILIISSGGATENFARMQPFAILFFLVLALIYDPSQHLTYDYTHFRYTSFYTA